jgi:hypothetical protein
VTMREPSVTFSKNLCNLGTYLSTYLACVGFSMSRSMARSVNSCQLRASTWVFFDLGPPTWTASASASIYVDINDYKIKQAIVPLHF